jgi:hypothetical protein
MKKYPQTAARQVSPESTRMFSSVPSPSGGLTSFMANRPKIKKSNKDFSYAPKFLLNNERQMKITFTP